MPALPVLQRALFCAETGGSRFRGTLEEVAWMHANQHLRLKRDLWLQGAQLQLLTWQSHGLATRGGNLHHGASHQTSSATTVSKLRQVASQKSHLQSGTYPLLAKGTHLHLANQQWRRKPYTADSTFTFAGPCGVHSEAAAICQVTHTDFTYDLGSKRIFGVLG